MYPATCDQANLPAIAIPTVTAGLRCSALKACELTTPTNAPRPHPAVMTIHPALLPLVRDNRTFATTPFPRITRKAVPRNSASREFILVSRIVCLLHNKRPHGRRTQVAAPARMDLAPTRSPEASP